MPSRRHTLQLLAATALVPALPGHAAAEQRALASWFARTYPATYRVLAGRPTTASAPPAAVRPEVLARAIRDDHLAGRVAVVDGFVLSTTEIAVYEALHPWLPGAG